MSGRLAEVEPIRRARHGPSRALVLVDHDRCPACGEVTTTAVMVEVALFYARRGGAIGL